MPKKFAFSDDGSRYHTLKYHNRRFWGRPVYKAVVDAGFTCPNIDGSCGVGGGVYCSGGSGYFTAPELSVRELGELLDPPLTRSGVNHRLRRLMELAEENGR